MNKIRHGTIEIMAVCKNFRGNPIGVPERLIGRLTRKIAKHWRDLGVTKMCFTTVEDRDTGTTAIAICSPLDTFDKSMGITIAEGRLKRYLSDKKYSYKPKFISDED